MIALIPARSGSKRVKDKNIRDLGGWPLMRWTVETAKQCGFEKIIVSSDSEDYLKMAWAWGVEGVLRPPEFCQDSSTDADAINHAILWYRIEPGRDIIVYLRPTTPFRTVTLIKTAIETFRNAGENATSLRSVEEMTESALKCFEVSHFGFLKPIAKSMIDANLPNQLVPKTYKGNGYIDIIKPQQALTGDLWGDKCIGFITPRTVEIDTEYDFWYAEKWLQRERLFDWGKEEHGPA